ncbi:hypothetical protein EOD39_17759 [Acipenser ruthenus]|uniref:Uncharacterized protein n=1 Tax=Acipenser ruthenus TaxID=7906 RepID=A0A444V2M2_ACIRT|nr:hypothetical protein EOD39_17759 [Acipenser ruthenus]
MENDIIRYIAFMDYDTFFNAKEDNEVFAFLGLAPPAGSKDYDTFFNAKEDNEVFAFLGLAPPAGSKV